MRFSIGSVRQWHWISAAICMIGMLMFAVTGITLNHAADIGSEPLHTAVEATIPESLARLITPLSEGIVEIPHPIRSWLADEYHVYPPSDISGEWDGIELYAAWPGPGKDTWLSIDPSTRLLIYESTDRGWIAYFNDLHKGRDSGTVWKGFIDVFAVICVIFTITGLQLLMRQAPQKAATWPVTVLGFLVPIVIMLVFIH